MSKPVIVLNELTKSYGKHRGIENISFTVEQGEVFGFIGPNGAGKSTTIRTLMGLLKPSNGGASIFGLDCSREPARIAKDVGYLPSENCYYNSMKVKEMLLYTAELYGVAGHDRWRHWRSGCIWICPGGSATCLWATKRKSASFRPCCPPPSY